MRIGDTNPKIYFPKNRKLKPRDWDTGCSHTVLGFFTYAIERFVDNTKI